MPFGLRNTPATFQQLMHLVLADVKNCEVYLDDVVAYSATAPGLTSKTLEEIFKRLKGANLTLNLAKREFGKATVTYQVGQCGCQNSDHCGVSGTPD